MTKIIRNTAQLIGFIVLVSAPLFALAQEDNLTKEVQVVRPYEPTISDAFKINQLPQVEDTIRVAPNFIYNLTLRPVSLDLPINPIPAARMVAEPLIRISKGYIKAGFGNYTSPLAEVYYSNERSKDYSYGVWLKHRSSFGNIKLDNNHKVDGDYHHTNVTAFGKRIFENSSLAGNINVTNSGYGFYGYDTSLAAQPIPPSVDEQIQQQFRAAVSYYSTHSDSTHLNYWAKARFNYFTDKFNSQQNTLSLQSNLSRFFKMEKLGGDIEFTHHMNSENISPSDNTIFKVSPWIGLYSKQWQVRAGIGMTIDNNNFGTQTHFYPMALLSYDIISNYVIPYFQFSGYLEDNSYTRILSENPWVMPGLNVFNTSHKFIMRGGLKGNFSPRIAYNLSASYSLVDSAYFYVNQVDPTGSFLGNRFTVVYDNTRQRNFIGELTFAPTKRIKLYLQAEFFQFILEELSKPWHKPDYAGRVMASYNIQDKIILTAGFLVEGKRYIQSFDGSPMQIDGLMDLNLGIEYRYNRKISAFLDLNNITRNRYHIWHLYPVQQFNMRGGITYSF